MKHPLVFLLPLALFGPARLFAQVPELVTVKDGHIGPVRTACYAPDERQALTGGTDRRVVLWDLDAKKYVRHVETSEVPLQLAFTRNGRGAVVLMYDRLQHWDLESGSLLREHRLPEFHDHFIRTDTLWLEKEGKPTGVWVILQDSLRSIPPQGRNLPQQPTFNPDDYPGLSARIAAFSLEDNVQWKHIPSRKLVLLYGGETTGYWMVTPGAPMNRDGSGFLLVWDLLNDRPVDTLIQVPEQILHVTLNDQGTRCLAGSEDKKVYHFDITDSRILHTYVKESTYEVRYSFAGDISSLAMIDYHGHLKLWPLRQRTAINDLSAILEPKGRYGTFQAEIAAFSPDQSALVAGNRTGELIRIPLEDPLQARPFQPDPHLNVILDLQFTPDGGDLLVGSTYESRVMMMYLDELPRSAFQGYIRDEEGKTIGLNTTDGPKYGVISEEDPEKINWSPNHNTLSLWNAREGSLRQLFSPYDPEDWVIRQEVALSPEGRYAFSRIDGKWHAWTMASGVLLRQPAQASTMDGWYSQGQEGFGLSIEKNGRVRHWPLDRPSDGDLLPGLEDIAAVDCPAKGGLCWFLTGRGDLMEWSTETREIRRRVKVDTVPEQVRILATPDPDLVLLRGEGSATLLHMDSGNTLIHLARDPNDVCEGDLYYDGHRASDLSAFTFLPDSIHALSATYDGNIAIWKFRSGERVGTLSFPGGTEWVVSTPDGLFDATEGAMRQMYFRIGTEVIELEQLKERYFEPGLLQKMLGFAPGGLRSVQELRNIALYPQLAGMTLEEDQLTVSLEPRSGGIGRVALLLNHNVELQANINPDFASTFTVDLSAFRGHWTDLEGYTLSLRAYNREGWLKSPPHLIREEGSGARGSGRSLLGNRDKRLQDVHLYALVVGTSTYRGEQLNLKYPDKDALAYAEALRITAEPLFGDQVSITTLTTSGSTWPRRQEIAGALAEIAASATPNDILLVYLSGHGITYPPNSEQGQFYYLTTDILSDKLDDPVTRMTQAIGQDTLQEWIRQVKALKRILILDACNSGKVVESLSVGEKSLNSDQRRALERMYDRSGMFVLAGSAGDKLSFEASQFGHGLLTYSLLNNIPLVAAGNGTLVDVGKLFHNTLEEVPRLARDIGKHQQPELIGNSSFDIGILTPQMPFEVPQSVPVYIRPSFLNLAGNRDNVRLSGALGKFLEDRAREPQSRMAFWDIDDYQGKYFFIGGTYTTKGTGIECRVSLYERDTLLTEFTLSGDTGRLDDLVEEIAQTAFLHIDQRN